MTSPLKKYVSFLAETHYNEFHPHFLDLSPYTVHEVYREIEVYHLSTGERVILCSDSWLADEWAVACEDRDVVVYRDVQNETMRAL